MYVSGTPIKPEEIPPEIAPRVSAEAPRPARMMLAKALLPLPPEQLGLALGVMARDGDQEIAEAAVASLRDLPKAVLHEVAGGALPAPILDSFAYSLGEDIELLRVLVQNEACADDTVRWMALRLKGPVLQIIAGNQRRYLRYPSIIGALINNPETPTPLLAPVVETALRNDLETASIVGFRELAQAFFTNVDEIRGTGPVEGEEEVDVAEDDGIEEDLLADMLRQGADVTDEEDVQEEQENKALWRTIGEMSVPQKVRLALMGDAAARRVLVRDAKVTVVMAVMNSPRMTLREISLYSRSKTLPEEAVRHIARKREWCKNYTVRLGLVNNPKCPPTQALTFLQTLQLRDIRKIAKARDVPAYIARAAKNQLSRRL